MGSGGKAVGLAERNANMNKLSNVSTTQLEWGGEHPSPQVDCIIGSDITYGSDFMPLIREIKRVLQERDPSDIDSVDFETLGCENKNGENLETIPRLYEFSPKKWGLCALLLHVTRNETLEEMMIEEMTLMDLEVHWIPIEQYICNTQSQIRSTHQLYVVRLANNSTIAQLCAQQALEDKIRYGCARAKSKGKLEFTTILENKSIRSEESI